MKRRMILLFAVIVACAAVSGCGKESRTPNDPLSVVRENVDAMNARDVDRMMATIDEQSPSYDQTKTTARKLFEVFELKYDLDSVKVIMQTDDEARVECIQTTTKVKGPEFKDNRIVFIHSLKKSEGIWKIYTSFVRKLDYLN